MKGIKKYFKNKVLDIVKEYFGEKPTFKGNNFYEMFAFSYLSSCNNSDDKEVNGSGIFKDIKKLKEKVEALEDLLKVKYVVEEKEFKGYKKRK